MTATPRTAPNPVYLHATAVVIDDAGFLIRGPSRAGKSTLALALLDKAVQAGRFARLVGDDRIGVERQGNALVLRGHPAILGRIEKRGTGILEMPFAPEAIARYIIDLAAPGTGRPAEPAASVQIASVQIEGVDLPLVTLPADVPAASRANFVMDLALKTGVAGSA